MSGLALDDELLDAQLMRTVGTAPYGGADVGECLAAAARVRGTDLDGWYTAWTDTAEATARRARAELAAGRTASARRCFLRAANYHRTAGVMLLGTPLDERLRTSTAAQTETFRAGAALLDRPPEILAIPFGDTTLPAYHFRAGDDAGPRPTAVLLGGYDGTAEELYFLNGVAALERGFDVLAFDGPGQGSALVAQGLVLRPDYETVVGAVLDHLVRRPGTDPDRIVLIGLSLGAHLGPRAAATERRLAACVADCGSYDLFASALERMPPRLAAGLRDGSRVARLIVRVVLRRLAAKPTAGWALRRGQLVHGVGSPIAFLDALREYTLEGRAAAIRCPTLVCHAEGDDISASAPRLAAALPSPTVPLLFTAAEGAGGHCEPCARTLFHERAFAWLDEVLP